MNCDDILFNFMVANHTQSAPVILDNWARPYNMGGLWSDPAHFQERSDCMNRFVEIFGYMPLKYTSTFFMKRVGQSLPRLKDLIVLNQ